LRLGKSPAASTQLSTAAGRPLGRLPASSAHLLSPRIFPACCDRGQRHCHIKREPWREQFIGLLYRAGENEGPLSTRRSRAGLRCRLCCHCRLRCPNPSTRRADERSVIRQSRTPRREWRIALRLSALPGYASGNRRGGGHDPTRNPVRQKRRRSHRLSGVRRWAARLGLGAGSNQQYRIAVGISRVCRVSDAALRVLPSYLLRQARFPTVQPESRHWKSEWTTFAP
jgi:hypothetical protein